MAEGPCDALVSTVKKLAINEWPWHIHQRSSQLRLLSGRIWHIASCLWSVVSAPLSKHYHFWSNVTASDLENSFIFEDSVMTLGACQGHSSIASFFILTSESCGPSAISELLVLFLLQLLMSVLCFFIYTITVYKDVYIFIILLITFTVSDTMSPSRVHCIVGHFLERS